MITHTRLEPDILECEVKWSLGNITMNKASGGGRIPVELLQILKDDAVKVLHSVQFSSVVQSSPTLRPHEPQHARPPCPLPTPGVHPNPCPLSQGCHLTISSSVILFSFCLQSFPTSGSFQMSQLFPLNMSANLENSEVATGLEKVSFHSNPKERQCQRTLKLPHNCTHLTR